jgi:hypothetical protein
MSDFFRDRLNVAWLASLVAVVLVLVLVPNEGAGTVVLIVVAVVAIVSSGAIRIRDAKRDRARKAERRGAKHGPGAQ